MSDETIDTQSVEDKDQAMMENSEVNLAEAGREGESRMARGKGRNHLSSSCYSSQCYL